MHEYGQLPAKEIKPAMALRTPGANLATSDFVRGRMYPSQSAVPAYGWAVPVQPFLPEVEITHQQNSDVDQHLHKPRPP